MSESVPQDDDHGVSTDDVLEVYRVSESPVITTRDVAELLGCSRDVARRRLRSLLEDGVMKRSKQGPGNADHWWAPGVERAVERTPQLDELEPVDMGDTDGSDLDQSGKR